MTLAHSQSPPAPLSVVLCKHLRQHLPRGPRREAAIQDFWQHLSQHSCHRGVVAQPLEHSLLARTPGQPLPLLPPQLRGWGGVGSGGAVRGPRRQVSSTATAAAAAGATLAQGPARTRGLTAHTCPSPSSPMQWFHPPPSSSAPTGMHTHRQAGRRPRPPALAPLTSPALPGSPPSAPPAAPPPPPCAPRPSAPWAPSGAAAGGGSAAWIGRTRQHGRRPACWRRPPC